MNNRFWSLLWSSFLEINGLLIALLSVIITFLFYIFSPQTQVPFYIVVAILFLVILIIVTLANALGKALRRLEKESAKGLLPRVVKVFKPNSQTSGETIYLLEPSKLFSSDVLVSFYYIAPQGLEVAIGAGVVTLVQDSNDFIQTQILYRDPAYQDIWDRLDDIWDRLDNNDAEILSRIIAKSAVTRQQVFFSIPRP